MVDRATDPGFPRKIVVRQQFRTGLQMRHARADTSVMNISLAQWAAFLLAGMALTLYIMRRRSRLGKRTPKF